MSCHHPDLICRASRMGDMLPHLLPTLARLVGGNKFRGAFLGGGFGEMGNGGACFGICVAFRWWFWRDWRRWGVLVWLSLLSVCSRFSVKLVFILLLCQEVSDGLAWDCVFAFCVLSVLLQPVCLLVSFCPSTSACQCTAVLVSPCVPNALDLSYFILIEAGLGGLILHRR